MTVRQRIHDLGLARKAHAAKISRDRFRVMFGEQPETLDLGSVRQLRYYLIGRTRGIAR